MTAFANRLGKVLPGFGPGQMNDSLQLSQSNSLTSGANTVTLAGPFVPTMSSGWIRVRVSTGGGTSPTLTDMIVTVTDGTTTVNLYVYHPNVALALSANIQFDVIIPFLVDINVNSLSVVATLAGTSPTAKLDVEIEGAI